MFSQNGKIFGCGGAQGCVPLDGESSRVAGLSQCTPHFSFCLAKRETGRTRKGYAASVSGRAANGCAIARSKEKKRFNALRCSGPPATGVGVSVPAPILPCLRARLGLLRGQYYRPVPDGADLIGVVVALNCFSFTRKGYAASVSGRAANGCAVAAAGRWGFCNGPMRASAPTGTRKAIVLP